MSKSDGASNLDHDALADGDFDAVTGGQFVVERIVTDNKDPDGTY